MPTKPSGRAVFDAGKLFCSKVWFLLHLVVAKKANLLVEEDPSRAAMRLGVWARRKKFVFSVRARLLSQSVLAVNDFQPKMSKEAVFVGKK